MKKFDGETNVLWHHLEIASMPNSFESWNTRIATLVRSEGNSAFTNQSNKAESLESFIRSLEEKMDAPVHLFWIFPEKWDRQQSPIVAYSPLGIKHELMSTIPAVDSDGRVITVSKAVAEQRPVVVITFNERTRIDGTLKNGMQTQSQKQNGTATVQNNRALVLKGYLIYNQGDAEWFWEGEKDFAVVFCGIPVFPGGTPFDPWQKVVLGPWTGAATNIVSDK